MLHLNMVLQICNFIPAHIHRIQAGTESQNTVCFYVCFCVRCYLLILLQSFQYRGGILSDLCRSQSLGTSNSMILCLGLDDCSSIVK